MDKQQQKMMRIRDKVVNKLKKQSDDARKALYKKFRIDLCCNMLKLWT